MTKGRMEAFSDGVFAVIITIMVLEMKSPKGTGLCGLAATPSCFLQLCPELRLRRHLLEQPSSPPAGGEACYGRHPVGESAFVVLALVDPVRYRLDGGEPFCALAGGVIRRSVTVRRNRLFPSDEETDRPPRKRFSPGGIDWK